ncbi:hypothetical protein F4779DRAFT_637234 [Xylariaceae sp. FL0662B]|nr:hypothetical protein F4779DRAFT_637234 [Xylariaceae sp. FL0662B]
MARYHISVRNYRWSRDNILVQSPVLDLNSLMLTTTLVVRPLTGTHEQEPRIIRTVTELSDDIRGEHYEAEAHGVFVPMNLPNIYNYPVWAIGCQENKIPVVNLTTFEAFDASIFEICWVPGFEAPDHSCHTVLGAPQKIAGGVKVLTIRHQLGPPREVEFNLLDQRTLARYDKIGPARKKTLFKEQLRAIRASLKSISESLLNTKCVSPSPDNSPSSQRLLGEMLNYDFDSSDDESLYHKPKYTPLAKDPSYRYTCDCKYADLGPTCWNLRPRHRHVQDRECALGMAHAKHCIFTDHEPPVCVIPSSGEPHEHCVESMEVLQSELERSFGQSCCADADGLLDVEKVTNFDLPDVPLPSLESPPPTPRADPSEQMMLDGYEPERTELDRLPDLGFLAETAMEGPIWGPRMDHNMYMSPEPQDTYF